MQGLTKNSTPQRRRAGAAPRRALAMVAALAAGALSACSSAGLNPFTPFADPGTYEFYSCDQIAAQQASWQAKEKDLKLLMDKASESTGGAVVNVIAYQADYARTRDELKVLDATARSKNCKPKQ